MLENTTLVPPPVYDFSLAALRDSDRDRYLACLLSPQDKRGPLSALYAFHAEIARVRDLVREPLPGEIRLQWWRDVLDDPTGASGEGNPLAEPVFDRAERAGAKLFEHSIVPPQWRRQWWMWKAARSGRW